MPSFPEKSLPCQKMYLRVRVPGSLKREQAGYVSDFAGNTSALEVEMLPRRSCVLASFFHWQKITTIDSLNGGKMNLTHTLTRFSSSLLCCLWTIDGQDQMVERHAGEEVFFFLVLATIRRKREEARNKVYLSKACPVTYLIQLDSISLLLPPPSSAVGLRIHQGMNLLIPFKSSVSCHFPQACQSSLQHMSRVGTFRSHTLLLQDS